ncbi:MAG: hypothetical protein LLG20_10080 [Acidobacteriales bacterium]|nr:hypothetical protein [Terriglobales bacterium]
MVLRLGLAWPHFLSILEVFIDQGEVLAYSYLVRSIKRAHPKSEREEAGVLGAGLLVLDRLYEIPALKPPGFLLNPEAAAGFRATRGLRELSIKS